MTATFDTNIFPAVELIFSAERAGVAIAITSTVERELRSSSLMYAIDGIAVLSEMAVLGEFEIGQAVVAADNNCLDQLLDIIGDGAFPRDRRVLYEGQRKQLRDALILEAHIRNSRDIFVSNDAKGFINHGKRFRFEAAFSIRIMNREEFGAFCINPAFGSS